jgi:hypothetical protein
MSWIYIMLNAKKIFLAQGVGGIMPNSLRLLVKGASEDCQTYPVWVSRDCLSLCESNSCSPSRQYMPQCLVYYKSIISLCLTFSCNLKYVTISNLPAKQAVTM